MKQKGIKVVAVSLISILTMSSVSDAGNIKKTYINVSKEGGQATASDLGTIAAMYPQIKTKEEKLLYDAKGNHGTVYGTGIQKGNSEVGLGNIWTFTPSDYVEGTSTGLPTGNSKRTLEAWVKVESPSPSSACQALFNWGVIATNQRSGLLVCSSKLYYVGEGNDLASGLSIQDGKWHHVAATFDGTTLKLYVDGTLSGTKATTFNTMAGVLRIGKRSPGDTRNEPLKGSLDEIRIWNTDLSETTIKENMKKSMSGNEPGLVGYWNFN